MTVYTLVEVVAALVTFAFCRFVFRHRLIPAMIVAWRWFASRFNRPNSNATWQDAYAPHCKACGYDLRASPMHCPECGEPVPAYERTIIHYLIKIGDDLPKSDVK